MRRLLALVGAIVFLDTMFFVALTPLLPHYADRFGLSKVGAGVLAAAYPAGVLFAGLPSGFASARFGPRATVVAALVVMAGTTLAFGLANDIYVLDGARFAQGVVSACAWTAGFAWLIGRAPAARRGELIGTALGTAIVGALFGPVLGGLASLAGTAAIFGSVGGAALLLAVAAAAAPPAPTAPAPPMRTIRSAVRSRPVAAGIWLVALPALYFGTQSVLAPLRLSALGLGALGIAVVYVVSAGLEAAVNPIVGRFSDRRGRRLPITVALAGVGLAAALLPWPDHRVLLAVVLVAGAVGAGAMWTPAMSLVTDASEARGVPPAFSFALINLAWAPGQALGSSAGGALADLTGDALPYLLLAGLCLLTLGALWRSGSSS